MGRPSPEEAMISTWASRLQLLQRQGEPAREVRRPASTRDYPSLAGQRIRAAGPSALEVPPPASLPLAERRDAKL